MGIRTVLACCTLLIAGSDPGSAQNATRPLVSTITVEGMQAILQDAGYRAEIVMNAKRPYIRTGFSGRRVLIYFYDCKEGSGCGSYQFSMFFNKNDRFTQAYSNAWNTQRRYSKTYIDKDGDLNLEWDVDLDGGVGPDFIRRTILSFERSVGVFDTFKP